MPLELVTSPQISTGVMSEGFVDGKLWDLHPEIDVRPGTCGRTPDRLFPSVEMVCLVGRQPSYVLVNVALPVFFFVPMAMLQFCVPRGTPADRLSVSLAIVLTTIAHKYSMMTLVPPLSYLTCARLRALLLRVACHGLPVTNPPPCRQGHLPSRSCQHHSPAAAKAARLPS